MSTFIYSETVRTPTERRPVSNPETIYGVDAPYVDMYAADGTRVRVKESDRSNAYTLGYVPALPTVFVTGTAIAGGVAEAAIVTGGETLIFTLSDGIWDADVLAQLEALTEADLLNGSASGAGSFDTEVSIDFAADCVRTTDTVLTLTLPATAGYSITGDETVTFGIPLNLVNINGIPVTASGNMTASPTTFVITNA